MEDILSFFKDTISIFLPSWQVQIYFLPLIPLFFAFFAAIYRISYLMNFPRVHSILEEPSPLLYFIRLLFTGSAFLIPLIQVWIHPWFDTEMEDIVLNSIWTAFSCISLTIVLVWMHIEHKKSRHLSWILMGFWFLNLMISISNVLVHLNLDTGFWPCVLPTCLLFLNLGCLCLSMLSAHKEEHELPTISFWTWLKYTLRFHPKCQKFPRWLLPTSLVEGEIGHHQALFQLFFRSSLPWLCLHVLFGLSLMYFIQTSLKVAGVLMCFLGWTYSIAKLHLGLGELKALTMLTKSVYLHTLQSIVPPTFEVWIQTPQKILNEVHWLRQSKIQCVLVFFSVVLLCTFIFESVFFDVVTPMLVSWMVTYWISLFRPVFEEHHFGLQWKTHRSILTWLQSIATFRCSLSMPVWLSHLKKEYKKERVCECYRQFSFFLPNLTDHACFFYSTYCVFQTGSPIMYFQLVCLASFYALKQSMTFKPTTYEQPSQVHPVSPRASFAKLPTMSMLKKPAIYIEGYLHCFFNELTVLLGEKNVELVQSILKQKVAYVPKVHWFIEGSIRDNILFGKGWDSDWFAEVIKCTELSDELTKFGHASIGINGSRLNERQMLQISFARAIYSRENVIFIEDPPIKELNLISVFSNCFGQGGITSSQCRIWLTGKPCIPCDWVFPLNKQVKKSNLQCEGGVMEIEHLHCSTELYPYGPSTWTSFSNFIKHAGLVIVPCLLLSVLLQGVFISLFIYIINDGFHFIFASVIYLLFYGCILILIGAGSWSISYNFFKLLIKTVSCFKLPMFEQHVNARLRHYFINDYRCYQAYLPSMLYTLTIDLPLLIVSVVLLFWYINLSIPLFLLLLMVMSSSLVAYLQTMFSKHVPFELFFQNIYRGLPLLHTYRYLCLNNLKEFLNGVTGIMLEKKLAQYWLEMRLSFFYAILLSNLSSTSIGLFFLFSFIHSMNRCISSMPQFAQALSAYDRIRLVTLIRTERAENKHAEKGQVRFISLKSNQLSSLTWTFRQGTKMGLYGPSAKHLFNTLLGTHSVQGTMCLNLDNFSPPYANWMLIPKKGTALPCTICEYLNPSNSISDCELEFFLKAAGSSQSLADKVTGETSIYLAKAMIRGCDVLLFEEPPPLEFVGVVKTHFQDCTVFVLSTFGTELEWTQEVLGVRNGKVIEWGTHSILAFQPGSLYSSMRAIV